MLRSLSAIGLAALTVPSLAAAQGTPTIDATVTAGYSFGSMSDPFGATGLDIDLSAGQLMFSSDIDFGAGFSIGFDVDLIMGNVDVSTGGGSADLDVDMSRISFEPKYSLKSGFYFGGYYQMSDIEFAVDPLPINFGVDLNSYGLFAGYESGPYFIEGFIGISDTDPGLPSQIDIMDYGIAGGYQFTPEFGMKASFTNTNIDVAGTSVDVGLLAVAGEYDVNSALAIYGSVGHTFIDIEGVNLDLSATQIALGMGYDLSGAGASIPAVLSAEIAYTMLDASAGGSSEDADFTTFTVGVTVPLGGGSSDPLNNAGRVAGTDYRSAIVGTAVSLF